MAADDLLANQPDDSNVQAQDGGGFGRFYDSYMQCEMLMERLKFLNYENEFVPLSDSLKVIPRHYFVNSTNTGEQFFFFVSISAWLIRKSGIDEHLKIPGEFDDPNETITNILELLKIKEVEINFSPNKLKSGSGPHCIFILSRLTEFALEKSDVVQPNSLEPIEAIEVESTEEEQQMDDAEITADQFDIEEDVAMDEDDQEDPENDFEFVALPSQNGDIINPMKEVLNDFVDVSVMKQELQRVVPQLKMVIRSNLKDWRMHSEQIKKYEDILEEQLNEIQPIMNKNINEITSAIERIQSRENHLNESLSSLLSTYRQKQNEFAMATEQYKERNGTLETLTGSLNDLNDEIDQLKQQIDEQSVQKTSGASTSKVMQAMNRLKTSIFTLRVQIATTEQTLMQTQLANRAYNAMDY